MDIFLSTHINKIDKKGRVSVPAQFRAALDLQVGGTATGIVVFRALQHNALEACSANHVRLLAEAMDSQQLDAATYDLLESTIFGGSHHLPFDSEGRVSLPENLLAQVGIDDSAAFVGRRNTFQIWQPKAFDKFMAEQRSAAAAHNISLAKIIADAKRGQL